MSSDDFQRRASEEGRVAQDIADRVINGAGFHVVDQNYRLEDLGVMVNFIATDNTSAEWYFDVSGSFTSSRAGLIRTDTMWKTLGRANVLHGAGVDRLLLVTTNLPKRGSAGDKAMHASASTFFDAVEMRSTEGKMRLQHYAAGNSVALTPLPGYRSAKDVYKDAVRYESQPGTLSVPVELTGDAIPVRSRYDVLTMGHRLKVFLPSTTRYGTRISAGHREKVGNTIVNMLSAAAGGCTSFEGHGSWIDPISGLVQERVTAIETYSVTPIGVETLWEILGLVVHELEQTSAAIIVDDRMYHFSPDAVPHSSDAIAHD